MQACCALLDAYRRDDWDSLILEPDNLTEKVDIAWKDGGRLTRIVQVKSSNYAIGETAVKRWANELVEGAHGAECVLQLCGPITDGVPRMRNSHAGVAIEVVGADVSTLEACCRDTLADQLDRVGRHGVRHGHLVAAVPRLAGLLFAEGCVSREWRKAELWAEVLRAVEPPLAPPMVLRWCQNRIVQVEANGECVETYINSFYNETEKEIPVPGVSTRLSDSPTDALYVFDGHPDATGEADVLYGTSVYVVWTPPRGTVPPGGWRHVGCVVKRRGLVRLEENAIRWEDVQLPHDLDDSCPVRVWMLVPRRWCGPIDARTAELVDVGGCCWKLSLGRGDFPRVEATGTKTPDGPVQLASWVKTVTGVAGLASGNLPTATLDLSKLQDLTDLPMEAMRDLVAAGSLL